MIVKNANPYLLDALWNKKSFICICYSNEFPRGYTIPIERILVIYDSIIIADNRDLQFNFGYCTPFIKFVVRNIEPDGNIFANTTYFDHISDYHPHNPYEASSSELIDDELRALLFQACQENICTCGSSHHFFPHLQEEENLTDEQYQELLSHSPIFEHSFPIDDPIFNFMKRTVEEYKNKKEPTGLDEEVVTNLLNPAEMDQTQECCECGCKNPYINEENAPNVNNRLQEFFRLLKAKKLPKEEV